MKLDSTTPLWLAARTLLHERGDDFFRRRQRVLKTFDPEDIHDLRVSSRRLRETLETFAPCYADDVPIRYLKRCKKVIRLMGDIRNRDEAHAYFSALLGELDESCRDDMDTLIESFRKSREKELQRLVTGLASTVPASLHDRFRRSTNMLPLFSSPPSSIDLFTPLGSFAGAVLDERLATVLSLVPAALIPDAIEAQHRLRIAVKHYRYRMEIFSFLFDERFRELHGRVKVYQDLLGKMHDLDVFGAMVMTAGFAPAVQRAVVDRIASQRSRLFGDFAGMIDEVPFESIGATLRSKQ